MRGPRMDKPIIWVDSISDAVEAGIDGAARWCEGFGDLNYICPCGCKGVRSIPVKIGVKEPHHWEWNGDKVMPTITPSIRHVAGNPDDCTWHGWMTKGKWVTSG